MVYLYIVDERISLMTLTADFDTPVYHAHHGAEDRTADYILWALPVLLLALVLALKTWGLVVLTLTALVMVPVMFVLIIWITLP
jgi:hypothetical protein